MCQYDTRCPTNRHRPGTVCPYAKPSGGGWSAPRRTPPPIPPGGMRPTPNPSPSTPGPRLSGGRYTRTATGDGLSLADLLALAVVGRSWERFHDTLGAWGYVVVALMVAIPFAVAVCLSLHCTAWNGTVEGRCGKVRPQFLRRCEVASHGHSAQFLTAHEVGAAVAFLAGCAGFGVLLAL